MPELEERQAKIEGVLEQVEKRVSRIEVELADLRKDLIDLRKEMHSNFRWLVGIMVSTWLAVMLAVLGLYYKG